jgi:mutator protein MutT
MVTRNDRYKQGDTPVQPVAAVISAVVEGDTVLLVKRRNPPNAGRWGFPGGKIEFGETVHQAAVRELHEEAGLQAVAERVFTAFDVFDHDARATLQRHFVLIAVLCRDPDGVLTPGSDASDARWFGLDEIEKAALTTSFYVQVANVARKALALSAATRDTPS